jgi:C-terminal processing protease CtpA/Prc
MTKVSAKVQDDMEMVFAFFYYSGKSPISHFMLFKSPEQENDTTISDNNKYVFFEEKSPQIAYLQIKSFAGTAAEMDSVFQIIIKNDYKNLIVDLRNNPGGNVDAGISFATSVVDSTFYGGVFLTQKWFNQHNKPPTVENYPEFPHFTEANSDLILDGIHNTTGLCLKIVPKLEVYKGNIYILTNKKTGSACEPIVYGLKQHKRATIIGEKTAGGMLNGEFFELEKGFSMYIPTADYYASDGFRIDQKGIKPNIKIKQEKA